MNESKHTILVVDDTPENIDVLRGILSSEYRIKAATDGEKALKSVLSETPPDLVLLDVMMPGIDGYEVCRQIKEDPRGKDVPIIFVTAMGSEDDETKGFELGAVDYITKPVKPALVLARVKTQLVLLDSRRKLENLSGQLSRYLSPPIWRSIFEGRQEAEIGARRRKLSVFFSDIVDFTRRTDHLEPEELTSLLNSYLERMAEIALEHEGTLDKFIGDAVMVFFGDPETRGEAEDAKACVAMAIEMQKAIDDLTESWARSGEGLLKVRMGIATGYCTVGNFGSSKRMDYTLIGNVVNLASRLESLAKPGQILVSHETWSLVADSFDGVASGQVQVKGFDRPLEAYEILREEGDSVIQHESPGLKLRLDASHMDTEARKSALDLLSGAIKKLEAE